MAVVRPMNIRARAKEVVVATAAARAASMVETVETTTEASVVGKQSMALIDWCPGTETNDVSVRGEACVVRIDCLLLRL